jgi:glutathione S-transferase
MVRLHYFMGRGRAETTRWMLAVNEIEFENRPLETAEDFDALKATGKLPFNQLPLLEIDGKNLSQSTAMTRYLARKGDFYGDGPDDWVMCDMVAGAAADFAETALQYAFQPTAEAGRALAQKAFDKFAPRFEAVLERNGGEWMAGRRMSFADVLLCEALENYHEISPAFFDAAPGLDGLRRRVTAHPGIAAYLASPNRWRMPDAQYVIDVARVLRRALPAHMPDPDRFVVK